jgi:hypothetical protein
MGKILKKCLHNNSRPVGLAVSKRRTFLLTPRHPEIGIINFGGILHHSARVRQQYTVLKINTTN